MKEVGKPPKSAKKFSAMVEGGQPPIPPKKRAFLVQKHFIARFGQFYVLSGLFLMQTTPSLAIVFVICPRSKWRTCKGGGEPGGTRDVKNTNPFWVGSDSN